MDKTERIEVSGDGISFWSLLGKQAEISLENLDILKQAIRTCRQLKKQGIEKPRVFYLKR